MAALGPYGTDSVNNNSLNRVTCPTGSYMQYVTGKGGDNVDSVQAVRCRNAVTGAITNVSMGAMGGGGGSPGTPLDCNNGSFDGLRGFQVWQGGELNRLVGKCSNPDASAFHFSGGVGKAKDRYHPDDQCPAGQMVYAVEGGPSNRGGQLTQFKWFCKDIQPMRDIATNALARGKCLIGDDNGDSCAEIKSSLANSDDDKNAYCTSGTNVVDSQNCKLYYNQNVNNAAYRTAMLSYCKQGDNYTTDACKNYCSWSSDAGNAAKSDCDALYQAKCANNPSSLCSCLQPWNSYEEAAAVNLLSGAPKRPDCYNATCIAHGYKQQRSESCPACVQSLIANGSINQLNFNNIVQSCGITAAPGAAAPTAAPTVAPAAASAVSTASTATPTTYAPASLVASVTSTKPSSTLLLLAAMAVAAVAILLVMLF